VQALLKEHEYWTRPPKLVLIAEGNRVHRLSRYHAAWEQPRPESYRCVLATAV